MQISGSTNDQLMMMAAHRYCLGRRSYIVGACIESLNSVWEQLTPNTQSVILRDTKDALAAGHAGDDIDIRSWTRFWESHN